MNDSWRSPRSHQRIGGLSGAAARSSAVGRARSKMICVSRPGWTVRPFFERLPPHFYLRFPR